MSGSRIPDNKENFEPEVIFAGAGPVGLFTAIQVALYCPDLKILMLEKHQVYQRTQTLFLNKNSFKGSHPDPSFQQLLKQLPHTVKIQELETKLQDHARKYKNIRIEYKEVDDCTRLVTEYSTAKHIIGADGSGSVVYDNVFNEYQIDQPLQYIAQLTYQVKGKTRRLHGMTEVVPIKTYCHHFIDESVSKPDEKGNTLVSLRVFMDEEAYEIMKGFNFAHPGQLSEIEKFDRWVRVSLQTWKIARQEFTEEELIEDEKTGATDKVTAFPLDTYVSAEFVREGWRGKNWYLVGDAAFGVPFFRSLNNGLLCGSQLAKVIHALQNNQLIKRPNRLANFFLGSKTPLRHYRDYVQALASREVTYAGVRSVAINVINGHYNVADSSSGSHILLTNSGLKERFKLIREENGDISYIANVKRAIKLNPKFWSFIKWLALGTVVATILYLSGGFALIPWIAPYAMKARIIGIAAPFISGFLAAVWKAPKLLCYPAPLKIHNKISRYRRKRMLGGEQAAITQAPQNSKRKLSFATITENLPHLSLDDKQEQKGNLSPQSSPNRLLPAISPKREFTLSRRAQQLPRHQTPGQDDKRSCCFLM